MYHIGRRVIIKAPGSGYHNVVGHVTEANYLQRNGKRKACYIVEYDQGQDVMLGSKQLRAADVTCDACGEWRKLSQVEMQNVYAYGEIDDTHAICWYCAHVRNADDHVAYYNEYYNS